MQLLSLVGCYGLSSWKFFLSINCLFLLLLNWLIGLLNSIETACKHVIEMQKMQFFNNTFYAVPN